MAEGTTVEQKDIKVVALADLFEDRLDHCHGNLHKLGIDVPKEHCFTGFDAYKQLLAMPEINYVILATPPHFRPMHLKAAIEAGKNVFMEKPVAVDVPGVKMVMEAGELAKQKGLGIAAGTQRRHSPRATSETIKRIHDGAIGEIVYAKCYWNGGEIWVIDREPGWSDMEWQLRNWNYFTWLSGDHIVEQHVHNLDVMNWVLGAHPVKAVSGLGGRQVRTGEQHGHIFDHFAVEFEYPERRARCSASAGRSTAATTSSRRPSSAPTARATATNCIQPDERRRLALPRARPQRPTSQEHEDLIASIRAGKPINEAQTVAESTMTGILGREAGYSGQAITWDEAMKSTTHLGPKKYEFGPFEVPPVARPGIYKFT